MDTSTWDGVHIDVEASRGQTEVRRHLVELTWESFRELDVVQGRRRREKANSAVVFWGMNLQAGRAVCHFVFGLHLFEEEGCAVMFVEDCSFSWSWNS